MSWMAAFHPKPEKKQSDNLGRNIYEMEGLSAQATHVRSIPKIGRNDPYVCGSGKKFKKCCLA